jgi:actinin alpha
MSTNQQKMMVWLQAQVDGYKGVALDNFHTAWRDGLAFCALVHSLSPRCGIKYEELVAPNASENLTLGLLI